MNNFNNSFSCCNESDNLIVPKICNVCKNKFYEKSIFLSSCNKAVTPWILTSNSKVISLYIKNNSEKEIMVYLQNSPNAKDVVNDDQRIAIAGFETKAIIPYYFSKYTRLVAISDCNEIKSKIWFQTQLI